MTDPNQDSTISLTLPVMASPPLSTRPSEIEEEVIFLFDQFYGRLSGYPLSFGLTVHDAEDIAQETVLALLRRPLAAESAWPDFPRWAQPYLEAAKSEPSI